MLKTKNLDDVFTLMEKMTQSKIKYPELAPPLIIQRFQKYSIHGFIFTFVFLVLFVATGQYLGITFSPEFSVAVLMFIVNFILLVLGSVYAMTVVATTWWDGKQYFPAMLAALKKDLHSDDKFITELSTFDKETLAYGLVQYRHRWSFAEGRVVAVVGDLRKLGLFPALTALIISIATWSKEDNNAIVLVSVIVTAILYMVTLYVLLSLERPKQVIQLLEYAIQHADQCNLSG